MDAASISANRLAQIQAEAALLVLRKALDVQASSALQLLQALPAPGAGSSSSVTPPGRIDTWA